MAKQKLTSGQFMLVIDGPSCGGKSAAANALLEQYSDIFHAKNDRIKWLISDYDAEKHKYIVQEMVLAVADIALKHNLSVLKEGGRFGVEKFIQLAKDFNAPVFIANISAPPNVLKQRFLERIENKKRGERVANVDPDRFWELNRMYVDGKMDSPLEFDSSVQSPEQIAAAISEYIQAHIWG